MLWANKEFEHSFDESWQLRAKNLFRDSCYIDVMLFFVFAMHIETREYDVMITPTINFVLTASDLNDTPFAGNEWLYMTQSHCLIFASVLTCRLVDNCKVFYNN